MFQLTLIVIFLILIIASPPCFQVLLVSTDPAHNLSDAFCQKIGREPTPIQGFDNLCAMEIDANNDMEEMKRNMAEQGTDDDDGGLNAMMSELTNSIPGIDEAMSFSELMKQVQGLDFDVVVFDTAPTGHTLRLLSFPTILEKALGKVMELKDRFGGLIGQATALMGAGPGATQDAILGRLEETRAVINKVNDAFQDPALTTFVSTNPPSPSTYHQVLHPTPMLAGLVLPLHISFSRFCTWVVHALIHDSLHVVYRSAFVFQNFSPSTKQNVWCKNCPSLVLILITLSLIKFYSPKRMPKSWQIGTKDTRINYQQRLKKFVPKCWLENECKTSTLDNALICMVKTLM